MKNQIKPRKINRISNFTNFLLLILEGDDAAPSGSFAEDNFNEGNTEGWYTPFKPMDPKNQMSMQPSQGGPPPAKKAKGRPHLGLGYKKNEIQWTPDGWVQKDTTHKVTSMMKPLPELDMIPPFSTAHPDAANDRDKRKMLKNNVNMMTIGMYIHMYITQCGKVNFTLIYGVKFRAIYCHTDFDENFVKATF